MEIIKARKKDVIRPPKIHTLKKRFTAYSGELARSNQAVEGDTHFSQFLYAGIRRGTSNEEKTKKNMI